MKNLHAFRGVFFTALFDHHLAETVDDAMSTFFAAELVTTKAQFEISTHLLGKCNFSGLVTNTGVTFAQGNFFPFSIRRTV